MAKSENNEVMFGARGQVGNLVIFKKYYGRTIIAKIKTKEDNPRYSQNQELVKERFKEGVYYAKSVLLDPVLTEFYKPYENGPVRIYNLALADFCKPPQIQLIKTEGYHGNIGDSLIIRAVDNFRVVQVMVTLTKPDGTMIEMGNAQQGTNSADWIYTASVANADLDGTIINVKVTDTPGNVTEQEQIVTV